ncbi:DUF5324 family protein [Streptomyces coeruleoprunus]|uniref:DUF5324 family protein n=1 Tax=Streptomyces coeruleoprunus TaxID=285563 RepID=A0ABV9XCV8_9ACTN
MTRMDSVRAATGSAKESVLHAAEVVAPYADSAKEQAAHYAHEARVKMAPKVSRAARRARVQYDAYVAPRVPPKMDEAAHRAALRTRKAARQAADFTAPRVNQARAAAGPVRDEAMARSIATLAALRGQVRPKDIRKLMRKQRRRARTGRAVKGVAVIGVLFGGAVAAWKWWDKQANPDWLVEPPAATDLSEQPLTSVDGSGPASLTPEAGAEPGAQPETTEDEDDDDRR